MESIGPEVIILLLSLLALYLLRAKDKRRKDKDRAKAELKSISLLRLTGYNHLHVAHRSGHDIDKAVHMAIQAIHSLSQLLELNTERDRLLSEDFSDSLRVRYHSLTKENIDMRKDNVIGCPNCSKSEYVGCFTAPGYTDEYFECGACGHVWSVVKENTEE